MPWKPGTPVRLETARYHLRSLSPDDVDDRYIGWLGDPEVMQTLNAPPRQLNRADIQRYVARFNNKTSFHIGVFDKASGRKIGIYSIYVDLGNGLAETNVAIGERDFWGRKAVLETRAALLDFLFDVVGVFKVWGRPFARNFPAVFNYKAQGFALEGVLRQHRRSVDGGRLDQLMFGLLRDEWHARRSKGAAA